MIRSFIGQAPITALCLLCVAWPSISTRKRESNRKAAEENVTAEISKAKATVDFAGIAAFTVMLTTFLLAISISDNTSIITPRWSAAALLATSLVAATALFFIERDYAKTPLIPLELLKGSLGVQMVVQVILLFAYFGVSSSSVVSRDVY